MKKLVILILAAIAFSSCSDIMSSGVEPNSSQNQGNPTPDQKQTTTLQTDSDVWVGAYLASYNHYVEPTGNWGNLPTDGIDWSAFTHLFYFSLNANADGSLSTIAAYQNMSPDRINAIVSAAHNHNKPVLITIGGWGNHAGFSSAIKPANRALFISNIVATIKTWGFDGVDLDMEPINSGDVDNYKAFINDLNTALQTVNVSMASKPLISVVTNWQPALFAQIQDKVDQINLMTYDLSGAWSGWVSWHNSAVSSGGLSFASNGNPLPSIDEKVKAYLKAGVSPSKLGIGIDFYGYVWSGGTGTSTGGVTEPDQSWSTAPTVTDNVPYHDIMNQYYNSSDYKWDSQAKAAYLSIDKSGSSNDKFVSYDDEKSIQAKFNYVRQKGLGGTIVWELSGGYRKNQPAGERDKLLQAVKQAMNNGSSTVASPTTDNTAPTVSVSAPADGSTVSGTVNIDIQASDNVGVSNVDLLVDGSVVKSFTTAPYTFSWNTTTHTNGSGTIEARASDAAGNTTISTVTVTVDNSTNTSTTSSADAIYEESLNSPWINSSWSATIDFSNTEQPHNGSKSVKVQQNSWGAFALHSGSWGQSQDIDPANYESVEFAIYAKSQSADISVQLENDSGQSFPKVAYGTVSANQWTVVSIPMSKLNPNGQTIHRIDILETSGTSKTYYIDDLKLVGSGSSSSNTGSGSGTTGSGSGSGSGSSGSGSGTASYANVYIDNLASPWINTSWSASVDLQNSELVGSAIKVVQNSWGALSLHDGSWSNTKDIDTSNYKSLEFKIYTPDSGVSLNVRLQSDKGSSPPKYSYGSVPSGKWVTVTIPVSELNPDGTLVQRLNFTETSGSTKTYYLDDIRFVKK